MVTPDRSRCHACVTAGAPVAGPCCLLCGGLASTLGSNTQARWERFPRIRATQRRKDPGSLWLSLLDQCIGWLRDLLTG